VKSLRQFLGGVAGGVIVIALIAGGVLLSAGDLRIASHQTPTPLEGTTEPTASRPPDTPTLAPVATQTPTLIPVGTCPRPPGWIDHIVAEGEDLSTLAALYNIEPILLQVNNCLNDAAIVPGQNLFVPAPATATATRTLGFTPTPTVCGPPPNWIIYRVKPGDTLFSLARATGTTVEMLMLANCLDNTNIRVGQALYVPRLPVPVATSTPTPTRTPTASQTETATATPTPSLTPSVTLPSQTATASFTYTPTLTETATTIPIISPTPSPTTDVSSTPTDTPTPTLPVPTDTPSPSAAQS